MKCRVALGDANRLHNSVEGGTVLSYLVNGGTAATASEREPVVDLFLSAFSADSRYRPVIRSYHIPFRKSSAELHSTLKYGSILVEGN